MLLINRCSQQHRLRQSPFIEFAKTNENLIFLVTEIGCGLAGLKPKEVAPLFKEAVNVFNIHLPSRFWHNSSYFNNGLFLSNQLIKSVLILGM